MEQSQQRRYQHTIARHKDDREQFIEWLWTTRHRPVAMAAASLDSHVTKRMAARSQGMLDRRSTSHVLVPAQMLPRYSAYPCTAVLFDQIAQSLFHRPELRGHTVLKN